MKRSEAHCSLDGKLRRLLWSMLLLVCVILVATLAILLLHNHQYSIVTANIVRASQFNQNFKEDVDLKMYYYVIDSTYGETPAAGRRSTRRPALAQGAAGRHAGPAEPEGHHERDQSL